MSIFKNSQLILAKRNEVLFSIDSWVTPFHGNQKKERDGKRFI
jgi:hypothetical protein